MSEQRIHYLDWLKVLIVYGIVVFHTALVFSFGSWLVNNHDRSIALSAFTAFCFPWGIPAMFFIAGADAWFSLRSHTAIQFVKGRVNRLLIPMLMGLIFLSPLQRFVTSHNPPPPLDQFGGFYLTFFRNFRLEGGLQWVATYWLHLWFLGYLFAISLVCAPFLIWLRGDRGRDLTARAVRLANRPGGLYLLGAPLFVSQVVLRPLFPVYQDWADVATFTAVFLSGALMLTGRAFEPAIRRDVRWFLLTGTFAAAGLGLILLLSPSHMPSARTVPIGVAMVYGLLWGIDVWSWLLAVLYLGIRWLDFSNRFLVYARESVLAIYVIHHPIVLVTASFVVTMSLGVWPKFAMVLVTTFAATFAIYEFGVRRWRPLRLLFGLKSGVPPSAKPPAQASQGMRVPKGGSPGTSSRQGGVAG